jgi:hypothetical protein
LEDTTCGMFTITNIFNLTHNLNNLNHNSVTTISTTISISIAISTSISSQSSCQGLTTQQNLHQSTTTVLIENGA